MTSFYKLTIKSKILLYAVVAFYTVVGQVQNGYECGNMVFTDQIVQETLAMIPFGVGETRVLPYEGPLYSRAKGYMIWPIHPPRNSFQILDNELGFQQTSFDESLYQVVFDERWNVIDLIVRLVNNEYGKCLRIDNSLPETSRSAREGNNGYQCGYNFISDETVQISISITRANIDKGMVYPSQYVGNLYDEEPNLDVWPIHGSLIHRKQQGLQNLYYVVVDSTSQVKDLLMVTATCHFLKCIRSRYDPPSLPVPATLPVSGSESNFPPRKISGFLCDKVFFTDDQLQVASSQAMNKARSEFVSLYPRKHIGKPCDLPCLLWPIRASKNGHLNGRYGPYRLVLTMDYKVMTVVKQSDNLIKMCERETISDGQPKNVNKYSYQCNHELFDHFELKAAAKVACKRLLKLETRYPARLHGFKFDIQGPYFVFPILKGKVFVSCM